MKVIKQQTNNDVFDTLMVCGDLISYITNNPTVLFSLINNLSKNQKTTLLKHFCKLGNLRCVKCLFSNGADIYDEDDLEEDPLYIAAAFGRLNVVRYLVLQGDNMPCRYEHPLCIAAKNGHLSIVKYFVSKGVNIHVNNECALLLSIEEGHLDIVKCLVSEGANIHINDEYPIYVAAMFGHLDIVEYLIEQGVDINHLSRRSKNLLIVTKILLKKLD